MRNLAKYKKFIYDVILNLIASGLSVFALQILVFPSLNSIFEQDVFGQILIAVAVINIIGVLFGSSLNNIRLKFNNKYQNNNVVGDFNLLLALSSIINWIVSFVIFYFVFNVFQLYESIILATTSLLMMYRVYLVVDFRINLNFRKILKNSIIYSLGLLLGLLFSYLLKNWIITFVIAEMLSVIFLICNTQIIKEPIVKTKFFSNTALNYFYLAVSNSLKNSVLYLDRLILYPILGSNFVAVFFASIVVGKMSSLVLTPVSGVILSYLSKTEGKMNLKKYFLVHGIIILFSLIASIVAIILSYFLIPILYANLFNQVKEILIIANIAAVFGASTVIPEAIVLTYSETSKQIFIQAFNIILYFSLGLVGVYLGGLFGFCIGLLTARLIKYIVVFFIGYKSIRN